LGKALIKVRPKIAKQFEWPWLEELDGRPATKKLANKFLLGAILDYQMRSDIPWENARRYVEDDLGDPSELWKKIARHSEKQWMKKKNKLNLHRFPAAHARVWRIARLMVTEYDGDARKIWKGKGPNQVLMRLQGMRVGEQISRMIVGGLIDTKQISIRGESCDINIKADLNTMRVLGRAVYGSRPVSAREAVELTHRMNPRCPWLLDRPLFGIGKLYCYSRNPLCDDCPIHRNCRYAKHRSHK